MARAPTLTEQNFQLLEGKLAEMRERQETRPKQLPVNYVATLFGVARSTVQGWLYKGRSPEAKEEHQRFVEIYDKLVLIMAERAEGKVFDIAYDQKNPRQLDALKLVLPRIDREAWGEQEAEQRSASSGYGATSIPRAVLDALTEDELLEVEKYQQMVTEGMEGTARVVLLVEARVAQQALEH